MAVVVVIAFAWKVDERTERTLIQCLLLIVQRDAGQSRRGAGFILPWNSDGHTAGAGSRGPVGSGRCNRPLKDTFRSPFFVPAPWGSNLGKTGVTKTYPRASPPEAQTKGLSRPVWVCQYLQF